MQRLYIAISMIFVVFTAKSQSCPDNNHPHAIDLSLPSGTKWACCNVGATAPDGRGGYYSWGETEEKEVYDWTTYIHCDGLETTCHDLGSNITGTDYDVASVQWGDSWELPTQEQLQELSDNSSYTWTTKNGVDGCLFTGQNGNTVFLPAVGIRWDGFLECPVVGGCYWSSTQNSNTDDSYRLFFDSWGGFIGCDSRSHGLSVRPVARRLDVKAPVITSKKEDSNSIYDLQGRRLNAGPQKGLYIRNGKKCEIKP